MGQLIIRTCDVCGATSEVGIPIVIREPYTIDKIEVCSWPCVAILATKKVKDAK